MSSFSSLNLGARAVFAAQRGLDITGQNIANSATPGYSRQRVDQVAVGGPTVPAIWSKYDQTGGGVKVTGVSRMRDEFLEARGRYAHQSLGQYSETQKAYEAVERTVGEPSTTGLQTQLADFWNAWGKISTQPSGQAAKAARDLTFERTVGVANQFNRMSNQMTAQWNDTRAELSANIADVNAAAVDIAKLNRAIRNNVINGLPANELADQRDVLVEKVTSLTGGVAERDEDGMVSIKLADNNRLVDGMFYRALATAGPADKAARDVAAASARDVGVQWETDPAKSTLPVPAPAAAHVLGVGTVTAELNTLNAIVPSYQDQLDAIATQLMTVANAQHRSGYAENGSTNVDLFTLSPGTGGVAGRIVVNPSVKADTLAVSSVNPTTPDANGIKTFNGDNAKDMSYHLNDPDGADAQFRSMVTRLGVEAQSIYRNQSAAEKVAKTADDARDAVSGVSLNEEMTNLMKYQHSFEAAAKFITAVDATIESLLSMTR